MECSVIYGALPYDVRHRQAELFANGTTEVVVATDAIGMGMNLPIRRVVLMETGKFDGVTRRPLRFEEIRQIVDNASRRTLVFADRFPFVYLAREYGLDCLAAFPSCTADTEPSAQVVMSLIDRVVSEGIPAVYTIELSTQAIARTVSEETGAKILTLHSMQTVTQDEFDAGESWVSLMEKNVQALREGLL